MLVSREVTSAKIGKAPASVTFAAWNAAPGMAILLAVPINTLSERLALETHGPLGTLWVGVALGCFYIALIWVNTLLGFFLTPLFVIPMTWLLDLLGARKSE